MPRLGHRFVVIATVVCTPLAASHLGADTPHLLVDLRPGAASGVPFLDAVSFDGKLYFNGRPDGDPGDLMVYDGVNPPSVVPGGEGLEPRELVVFQGALYFQGGPYGSEEDRELWRYSGVGPPLEVFDLFPGASSLPYAFAVFGSQLCFQARDNFVGAELRCWDGFQPLPMTYDLWVGAQGSAVEDLTVIGATLFFSGYPGPDQGRELGVFVLEELPLILGLVPGNVGSAPGNFTLVGSTVYFTARDPGESAERVWRYDGMGPALEEGLENLEVQGGMTAYGERLLVVGESPASGEARLHTWDGVALEVPANQDAAWEARDFVRSGPNVYFLGESSAASFDLFRYDGSGVEMVLEGDLFGYYLTPALRAFDGRLWFSADQADTGEELWWIELGSAIFADGFESGGTSGWSSTVD